MYKYFSLFFIQLIRQCRRAPAVIFPPWSVALWVPWLSDAGGITGDLRIGILTVNIAQDSYPHVKNHIH